VAARHEIQRRVKFGFQLQDSRTIFAARYQMIHDATYHIFLSGLSLFVRSGSSIDRELRMCSASDQISSTPKCMYIDQRARLIYSSYRVPTVFGASVPVNSGKPQILSKDFGGIVVSPVCNGNFSFINLSNLIALVEPILSPRTVFVAMSHKHDRSADTSADTLFPALHCKSLLFSVPVPLSVALSDSLGVEHEWSAG